MNEKINRYKELNELIFKLNTKRNQSAKDCEKLEKLHAEQIALAQDPEVNEYIHDSVML